MKANADTLNTDIDFYTVFEITATGELYTVLGMYAPSVEHDDEADVLLDERPAAEHKTWELFSTGYTGQYSYTGAVMHSSEQLSGRLADDIVSTPGIYTLVVVEAPCGYDGSTSCEVEIGCECEAAGWAILRRKAE